MKVSGCLVDGTGIGNNIYMHMYYVASEYILISYFNRSFNKEDTIA